MKSHGILMKQAMVLALLAGRKTQTRRLFRSQPGPFVHVDFNEDRGWHLWWDVTESCGSPEVWQEYEDIKCPYGEPGDTIWIKETFSPDLTTHYPFRMYYRATDGHMDSEVEKSGIFIPEENAWVPFQWRPSIFMPKSACRIFRRLKDLRTEHLQDISEADAQREGSEVFEDIDYTKGRTYREVYRSLWNFINLKPKPVYEKQGEKKVMVGYESYPWCEEDFDRAYPKVDALGHYRDLPIKVTPNPRVWVLELEKI